MAFQLGECLLRQRIQESKYNQSELAKKLGISRQMITKYITGERKMSLEIAINISLLLNCQVTDLYILEIVKNRRGNQ